jgi:diguanylate cyclase (GGDEF)-like protein
VPVVLLAVMVTGPESILGLLFGGALDNVLFVLPYLPFFLLLAGCGIAYYFNSIRLVLMGLFLGLVYGYATVPIRLGEFLTLRLVGPAYYNSQVLLPVLLPLTILGLHFTADTGLFTSDGLLKVWILLVELILLALLFPYVEEFVYRILGQIPQQRVLDGQLNLPFLSGGLTLLAYFVMWVCSEKNYYSNYLVLIFWFTITAVLSFDAGIRWFRGSFPLHHALFFTGSAVLYDVKVLNLAWGKAYRDQLTQIPGRMALDECLARLKGTYSICMIDIDKFKDFNDTFGHDAGDKVLKQVAELVQSRTSGRAFRFGGEEFTVVYNGRLTEDVEDELKQLRKTISDNKVKVTKKSNRATKVHEKRVTISLGLADSDGNGENPEEVLNAADEALFKAKDEGRNQLVLAS